MEIYFPLILDGATGTQLQKRGYGGGMCAEEWLLSHPEAIKEVQRLYVENGSDIVYASTFGGNRVKLEENKLFNKVDSINKELVGFSKEAVAGSAFVAGDLAPTGQFLAPLGDMPFDEMVEVYEEQAKALEEAGVDLFVIETMMTVPEARAAVLAVKNVSKKPVFVSFTCDNKGKTLTGTDVTAALLIMQGMGVDAFGLNCSVGPDDMLVQLRRLSEYAEVPLIAKPNAGIPELVDGKTIYSCTPEEFSKYLKDFAQAGVAIFGGCCGTTEDHIKAIYEGTRDIKIKPPAPAHPDMLPLATEKMPTLLNADIVISQGDVLPCDESLADALSEEADKESPVTAIRIKSFDELSDFEDNQISIKKPLCILCEDAGILEEALRLYQGRAMYEGSIDESILEWLAKKYGLVY